MSLVPTLQLSPGLSRDRAGIITPSKSGAVRDVTLDGAPAWQVIEGTTNYDSNPLSAIIKHIINGYAHVTGDRITDAGLVLPNGQVVNTATRVTCSSSPVSANMIGFATGAPFAAGSIVTIGVWFKPSPSLVGKSFYFYLNTIGGASPQETSYGGAGSAFAPVAGWQYRTATLNVTRADSTGVYFYLAPSATPQLAAGDYMDFTAVQAEAKAYPSPFCPAYDSGGVLYPDNIWTGTPHASTSTRSGGGVAISSAIADEAIDFERGSFYLRARDTLAGAASGVRRQWRWGAAAAGSDGLMLQTTTANNLGFSSYAGATQAIASGIPLPNGVYSAYGYWDGNDLQAAVNGSFGTKVTRLARIGVSPSQSLQVGGSSSSQQYNGDVAVLLFYDRPLTTAELARLDATPTALLGWNTLIDSPAGMLPVGSNEPVSVLRVGGNPLSIVREL